jgi:hypothetical protein
MKIMYFKFKKTMKEFKIMNNLYRNITDGDHIDEEFRTLKD